MRGALVLPALSVQAVQKRHQRIDLAFAEAERMDEPVEVWIRMRAAIVELHDVVERGDGAVVHVGRVTRHLSKGRGLERSRPVLEHGSLRRRVMTQVRKRPGPRIPADAGVVESASTHRVTVGTLRRAVEERRAQFRRIRDGGCLMTRLPSIERRVATEPRALVTVRPERASAASAAQD